MYAVLEMDGRSTSYVNSNVYQYLALANTQVFHYGILTRHSISHKKPQKAWNIFWQNPQCNGTGTGEYHVKYQNTQAKTDK